MSDINFEIIKYIQKHGHAPNVPGLMTVLTTANKAEREVDYFRKLAVAKSLNKQGRKGDSVRTKLRRYNMKGRIQYPPYWVLNSIRKNANLEPYEVVKDLFPMVTFTMKFDHFLVTSVVVNGEISTTHHVEKMFATTREGYKCAIAKYEEYVQELLPLIAHLFETDHVISNRKFSVTTTG